MRLVEFETTFGNKALINPERVDVVRESTFGNVEIILSSGVSITVNSTLEETKNALYYKR